MIRPVLDWSIPDISYAFLSILLEGAPFIFIGTLISGFIDAYLPQGLIDRWLPKNKVGAILLSGLLGAVFPVCECAIVPVIRRLIRKGLPVSCAITYMLSAPIINPIVYFSTCQAFSTSEGILWLIPNSRMALAYVVAVIVGFIILKVPKEAILRPRILEGAGDAGHEHAIGNKLVHAMRTAQRDFLDVAMYFVVGVALAAIFNVEYSGMLRGQYSENDWVAAPVLMLMAFIISLCSTSDAFIAASLNNFSYASRLAFMIFGPMMDVKLVLMYSSVFKGRFVALMAIGLFILVGFVCIQWGALPLNL